MTIICAKPGEGTGEGGEQLPAMYAFRHKLVHQIFLSPDFQNFDLALSVSDIRDLSRQQGVPQYEFLKEPDNAPFMDPDALADILEELTKSGFLQKASGSKSYKATDKAPLYDGAEDFRQATAAAMAEVVNKEEFAELLQPLPAFAGREQQYGDKAVRQLHELYVICAAFLQAFRAMHEVAIRMKKIEDGKGRGPENFNLRDNPPAWHEYLEAGMLKIFDPENKERAEEWRKAGATFSDGFFEMRSKINEVQKEMETAPPGSQAALNERANRIIGDYAAALWNDDDGLRQFFPPGFVYSAQHEDAKSRRAAASTISLTGMNAPPEKVNEDIRKAIETASSAGRFASAEKKSDTAGGIAASEIYKRIDPQGGAMNSVEFLDVVLSKSEKFGDRFAMMMKEGLWRWRFIDPRLRANDNPAGVGDLSEQTSPVGGAPNSHTQGVSFIWEMTGRMPDNMIKIFNSGFSEWMDRNFRGRMAYWGWEKSLELRKKYGEEAWEEVRNREGKAPLEASAAAKKFVGGFHFPDVAAIEKVLQNGGDDPFVRPLAAALGAEWKSDSAEAAAIRIFGAGQSGVKLESDDAQKVFNETPVALSFFYTGKSGAHRLLLNKDKSFSREDGSKFEPPADAEIRARISDRWNVIGRARATDQQFNADWAFGISHLVVGPGRAMDTAKSDASKNVFSGLLDIQTFKSRAKDGDLPQLSVTAQSQLNALLLLGNEGKFKELVDFLREKSALQDSLKEAKIAKALGLKESDIAGKSKITEVIRAAVIVAKNHDWQMDFDAFDELRLDLSGHPALVDLLNIVRPVGDGESRVAKWFREMERLNQFQHSDIASAAGQRDNQHLIHSSWLGATLREYGRRLKNELNMNPTPLSMDPLPEDLARNAMSLFGGPVSRALKLDMIYAATDSLLNQLFRAQPNFAKLTRDVFGNTFQRLFATNSAGAAAFWTGGMEGHSLEVPGIALHVQHGRHHFLHEFAHSMGGSSVFKGAESNRRKDGRAGSIGEGAQLSEHDRILREMVAGDGHGDRSEISFLFSAFLRVPYFKQFRAQEEGEIWALGIDREKTLKKAATAAAAARKDVLTRKAMADGEVDKEAEDNARAKATEIIRREIGEAIMRSRPSDLIVAKSMQQINSMFGRGKRRKDDFFMWYSGEATKLPPEEREKVESRGVEVMQKIMRGTMDRIENYGDYYLLTMAEMNARAHEVIADQLNLENTARLGRDYYDSMLEDYYGLGEFIYIQTPDEKKRIKEAGRILHDSVIRGEDGELNGFILPPDITPLLSDATPEALIQTIVNEVEGVKPDMEAASGANAIPAPHVPAPGKSRLRAAFAGNEAMIYADWGGHVLNVVALPAGTAEALMTSMVTHPSAMVTAETTYAALMNDRIFYRNGKPLETEVRNDIAGRFAEFLFLHSAEPVDLTSLADAETNELPPAPLPPVRALIAETDIQQDNQLSVDYTPAPGVEIEEAAPPPRKMRAVAHKLPNLDKEYELLSSSIAAFAKRLGVDVSMTVEELKKSIFPWASEGESNKTLSYFQHDAVLRTLKGIGDLTSGMDGELPAEVSYHVDQSDHLAQIPLIGKEKKTRLPRMRDGFLLGAGTGSGKTRTIHALHAMAAAVSKKLSDAYLLKNGDAMIEKESERHAELWKKDSMYRRLVSLGVSFGITGGASKSELLRGQVKGMGELDLISSEAWNADELKEAVIKGNGRFINITKYRDKFYKDSADGKRIYIPEPGDFLYAETYQFLSFTGDQEDGIVARKEWPGIFSAKDKKNHSYSLVREPPKNFRFVLHMMGIESAVAPAKYEPSLELMRGRDFYNLSRYEEFFGHIFFDEADNMTGIREQNYGQSKEEEEIRKKKYTKEWLKWMRVTWKGAKGSDASNMGILGRELARLFPNARTIYSTATPSGTLPKMMAMERFVQGVVSKSSDPNMVDKLDLVMSMILRHGEPAKLDFLTTALESSKAILVRLPIRNVDANYMLEGGLDEEITAAVDDYGMVMGHLFDVEAVNLKFGASPARGGSNYSARIANVMNRFPSMLGVSAMLSGGGIRKMKKMTRGGDNKPAESVIFPVNETGDAFVTDMIESSAINAALGKPAVIQWDGDSKEKGRAPKAALGMKEALRREITNAFGVFKIRPANQPPQFGKGGLFGGSTEFIKEGLRTYMMPVILTRGDIAEMVGGLPEFPVIDQEPLPLSNGNRYALNDKEDRPMFQAYIDFWHALNSPVQVRANEDGKLEAVLSKQDKDNLKLKKSVYELNPAEVASHLSLKHKLGVMVGDIGAIKETQKGWVGGGSSEAVFALAAIDNQRQKAVNTMVDGRKGEPGKKGGDLPVKGVAKDLPLAMTLLRDAFGENYFEMSGRKYQVSTEGNEAVLTKHDTAKSKKNAVSGFNNYNNPAVGGAVFVGQGEMMPRGLELDNQADNANNTNRVMILYEMGYIAEKVMQVMGRHDRTRTIGEPETKILSVPELPFMQWKKNPMMNKILELSGVSIGDSQAMLNNITASAYPDPSYYLTEEITQQAAESLAHALKDAPIRYRGVWNWKAITDFLLGVPPLPGKKKEMEEDEDPFLGPTDIKAVRRVMTRMAALPLPVQSQLLTRLTGHFNVIWNSTPGKGKSVVMDGDITRVEEWSVPDVSGRPISLFNFLPHPINFNLDEALLPENVSLPTGENAAAVMQEIRDNWTFRAQRIQGGKTVYAILDRNSSLPFQLGEPQYRVYEYASENDIVSVHGSDLGKSYQTVEEFEKNFPAPSRFEDIDPETGYGEFSAAFKRFYSGFDNLEISRAFWVFGQNPAFLGLSSAVPMRAVHLRDKRGEQKMVRGFVLDFDGPMRKEQFEQLREVQNKVGAPVMENQSEFSDMVRRIASEIEKEVGNNGKAAIRVRGRGSGSLQFSRSPTTSALYISKSAGVGKNASDFYQSLLEIGRDEADISSTAEIVMGLNMLGVKIDEAEGYEDNDLMWTPVDNPNVGKPDVKAIARAGNAAHTALRNGRVALAAAIADHFARNMDAPKTEEETTLLTAEAEFVERKRRMATASPKEGTDGTPLAAWWKSPDKKGWKNDPRMQGVHERMLGKDGKPHIFYRGMNVKPEGGNMRPFSFFSPYAAAAQPWGENVTGAYLALKKIYDPENPDHRKLFHQHQGESLSLSPEDMAEWMKLINDDPTQVSPNGWEITFSHQTEEGTLGNKVRRFLLDNGFDGAFTTHLNLRGTTVVVNPELIINAETGDTMAEAGQQRTASGMPKDILRGDDGNPTVFYHGTPATFDKFRRGRIVNDEDGELDTVDLGVHFALDESTARTASSLKSLGSPLSRQDLKVNNPQQPEPRRAYLRGKAYYIPHDPIIWSDADSLRMVLQGELDAPREIGEAFREARERFGFRYTEPLPEEWAEEASDILEDDMTDAERINEVRKFLVSKGVRVLLYPNTEESKQGGAVISAVALTGGAIVDETGNKIGEQGRRFSTGAMAGGKAAGAQQRIRAAAKRLGISQEQVKFILPMADEADAAYYFDNKSIELKPGETRLPLFTHEAIHLLRDAGMIPEKEYQAMVAAGKRMVEQRPELKERVSPEKYAGQALEEEYAALFAEYYFRESEAAQKVLAGERLSALERLTEFLREILDAVKAAFGDDPAMARQFLREMAAGKFDVGDMSEAERAFVDAAPERMSDRYGAVRMLHEGGEAAAAAIETGKELFARIRGGRRTALVSRGIEPMKLRTAKKMAAEGREERDIWRETALIRDPEGNWLRFVPSHHWVVTDEVRRRLRKGRWNRKAEKVMLPEVLRNKEFLKLFPEAREVEVRDTPLFSFADGMFGVVDGKPVIFLDAYRYSDRQMENMEDFVERDRAHHEEKLAEAERDGDKWGINWHREQLEKATMEHARQEWRALRQRERAEVREVGAHEIQHFADLLEGRTAGGNLSTYKELETKELWLEAFDISGIGKDAVSKREKLKAMANEYFAGGLQSEAERRIRQAEFLTDDEADGIIYNMALTVYKKLGGEVRARSAQTYRREWGFMNVNGKYRYVKNPRPPAFDQREVLQRKRRMAFVSPPAAGIGENLIHKATQAWWEKLDGEFTPESVAQALDNDPDFVARVWKETGIILGKDGRFRSEVSDDWMTGELMARIARTVSWRAGVGDAMLYQLSGDEIPDYVNDLGIKIDGSVGLENRQSRYGHMDAVIEMPGSLLDDLAENPDSVEKQEALRSQLAHEITHALQYKFQFALGGSPQLFGAPPYGYRSIDENRLTVSLTPEQEKELMAYALRYLPESGRKVLETEERRIKVWAPAFSALPAVEYWMDMDDLRDWAIRDQAEQKYVRLHGEAEAREVQARLGKSAEWRAKNPPRWDGVPAKELIVRMSDDQLGGDLL